MDAFTPCPVWLLNEARKLLAVMNSGRLHHALLITGIDGIGKRWFAQWLSEALLCQQRTETGACQSCPACKQLSADSHPEFRLLEAEGASATIKIDPVRELVDWLQLTAGANSYRVALIADADTLNHNAANALLKTLEEPADNAVLLLCATRAGRLPATVRSRCQSVTLSMEDADQAMAWLAEQDVSDPGPALAAAGNAPRTALANQSAVHQQGEQLLLKAWSDLFLHKGSVGRIADALSEMESTRVLAIFSRWCMLCAKQTAQVEVAASREVIQVISTTRDKLSDVQWITLHERLLQLHRADSASFKTRTVVEGVAADIRTMINS